MIHAEITRRNTKANVDRYSRHWYDLAKLSFLAPQQHLLDPTAAPVLIPGVHLTGGIADGPGSLAGLGRLSPIGARALARTDLRDHVIAVKKALFGVARVNYDEVAAGGCRLVPDGSLAEGLARDYAAMFEAGMFDETPPGWLELMRALTKLEQQINDESNQDR